LATSVAFIDGLTSC